MTVRAPSDVPPRTLRRTGEGGALSFDVYALVDADGWPDSATYTYVRSLAPTPSDE